MMIYLVFLLVAIIVFLVKITIDFYALVALVKKDNNILLQPNEKEKEYEFIKGLY
ncbi:hypothetical protein [Pedobacter rhizosphaerae]|uniref:Uncharacterized protein n=1 Tax=Pedobacter rhizosphaerae TaxID=390241 RepID=A0A1H9STY1_9SPHI|nr:hypothetical protein [Pedobacter rhizosphaerae]SER88371.1 hypothetical protein SAMN04488023_11987 [Pedobacter rhizosphaerae]